jgi:hypothetical protein
MIKSMEKHAAAFSEKYPEWSTGSRQKHGKQPESTSVADIVDKRLRQFVYNPCHAAAFVLDPLFFALAHGKWKLPYNFLSESERSDVDECVKRIGGEDAENELFDLVVMNLPCSQLLNKLYASCAAQEVQEDGKVVIAAVDKRQNVWSNFLSGQVPALSKVALWLMSMHASACSSERNWSRWGLLFAKNHAENSTTARDELLF